MKIILSTHKNFAWGIITLVIMALISAVVCVRIDYKGHREGIFILKGPDSVFTLTDDVYIDDETRVLFALTRKDIQGHLFAPTNKNRKKLDFEWDISDGSGYVENFLPGGKILLMNFSRFLDSGGRDVKGIFVGGPPPYDLFEYPKQHLSKNESGVTYFDGKRWQHIWCNVNEALEIGDKLKSQVYPSEMELVDSSVLDHSDKFLALRSRHKIFRLDANLSMTRVALFRDNETYFTLAVKIRNDGKNTVPYTYLYGDEPWVGDFGTCIGNVGWTNGKLHYYEERVDPAKETFAGIADLGNRVIGEKGPFTGMAAFIEWFGPTRPDRVFFENDPGDDIDASVVKPLSSPDNRSIMLRWGPRLLHPGESHTMIFAIGMAQTPPGGAMPDKPAVVFDGNRLLTWLNAR